MEKEKEAEITAIMPHMTTLKKASEITHFSYYMLRKLCLSGQVACMRNSGKIYINMDSLIELMNGGCKNG